MKTIIFSDLDGTLLDFNTYSYDEVKETVGQMNEVQMPLVFCSSKTRFEQEIYRKALGNSHPFITENGSAIFVPENYFDFEYESHAFRDGYRIIELGEPGRFIKDMIALARQQTGSVNYGYADLPICEVSRLTSLDSGASMRAANREYSETILKGDIGSASFEAFKEYLLRKGLNCVSGGKFHTVMGINSDKGKALKVLSDLYRKKYGAILTVGLGDSANDLPLLEAVDKPFLVQKPSGRWQEGLEGGSVSKVPAIGPAGWKMVVSELLQAQPS